ncbi:hypothetical protein [Sphingobium yanoikuyae]|uniref:hypothetical protein n=1 Tax=Sphingobium yanoikuyae TaxID=13690 RepID=UPI0028A6E80C|nr:hypothetical protein [Sphingobium yanoikuyae]
MKKGRVQPGSVARLPNLKVINVTYIPECVPNGGAQTLPFVRSSVQRAMMRIARDIGAPIDLEPSRQLTGTEGMFLLEQANLLIAGTNVSGSETREKLAQMGDSHGLDLLLLRSGAWPQSLDIHFHRRREWLVDYRSAWFDDRLWFMPMLEDGQPGVRASTEGLILFPCTSQKMLPFAGRWAA